MFYNKRQSKTDLNISLIRNNQRILSYKKNIQASEEMFSNSDFKLNSLCRISLTMFTLKKKLNIDDY